MELGIVSMEDIKDSINSEATDLYKVMGGEIATFSYARYWINEAKVDKELNYQFATVGFCDNDILSQIRYKEKLIWYSPIKNNIGIRLKAKVELEEIIDLIKDKEKIINSKDIYYSNGEDINLGFFPQDRIKSEKVILDSLYQSFKLRKTGNLYTYRLKGENKSFEEYEYEGKRYIRIVPTRNIDGDYIISDDYSKGNSKPVWIEVNPITWRLIKREGKYYLISKKVLMTAQGINDKDIDILEASEMKLNNKKVDLNTLLDEFTLKEIMKNVENEQKIKSLEKLQLALQKDIPIFLLGKENYEKCELLKKYDSDMEIVCLGNMKKDNLAGITVFDEDYGKNIEIKPTWLKRVEQKCEEKPDQIHIIFFDDIERADEEIKNMIIETTQSKRVAGKWNLPKNSRIIISKNKDLTIEEKLKLKNYMKINFKATAKMLMTPQKIIPNNTIEERDENL